MTSVRFSLDLMTEITKKIPVAMRMILITITASISLVSYLIGVLKGVTLKTVGVRKP